MWSLMEGEAEMSGRFPFLQEQEKGKGSAFSWLVLVITQVNPAFKSFMSWTLPSDLGWQEKVSARGWGLKSPKVNRKYCIL